MKHWLRVGLGGLVAALAILVAGYVWGASGKSDLAEGRSALALRLSLVEARAHLLAGRVSLFSVNFGDASRELEDARTALARAIDEFEAQGDEARSQRLAKLGEAVSEAQRLAGRVDQAANTRAAEALAELEKVLAELPSLPTLSN